MFGLSYLSFWIIPIFSGCVWLGTLAAMLGTWISEGSPHYPSMEPGQRIAYISDIGAQGLKPLFIAGSAVCVVSFDIVFISERWLRHKGRLAHNTSTGQKILSGFACLFAVIGACGLIFLTIFDTVHYPKTHDSLLVVFIVGYIISAIFICAEYQRLGQRFREYRVLSISFWVKLVFIVIEICLAITFAVLGQKSRRNEAAILEWIISLIYICYQLSFAIDFLPAVHSKNHLFPSITEMAESGQNGPSISGGPTFSESYSNNSHESTNPMRQDVTPSRNF